jgi:amino acid transporter
MISMALAGILAASRYLFGMGRDNLLPQVFEELNATYETPHWPIVATGLMMAFAILWMDVSDVAKLASGFQIMIFIVVNSCVIILRKSHPDHDWYQPSYKSPLYPFTQIFGIIMGLTLVIVMGEKAYIGAGFAIACGFILYYSYGKQHAHPRLTPFITFTEMMRNPSKTEHERRVAAFHAADIGVKNHLTLREFQTAMNALGFPMDTEEERVIFHQIDIHNRGYIDIDDFLEQFEGEIHDD